MGDEMSAASGSAKTSIVHIILNIALPFTFLFICGLGNLLLWFEAPFIADTYTKSAPMFFATLLAAICVTGSRLPSPYQDKIRTVSTILLMATIQNNVCAAQQFMKDDILQSGQLQSTEAQTRVVRAGAILTLIGGLGAFIVSYLDFSRIDSSMVLAAFKTIDCGVTLFVGLLYTIGCIVLWCFKDACKTLSVDMITPLMITYLAFITILTKDPEGRDITFFFSVTFFVTYAPVFKDLQNASQDNAKELYRAGISLLFCGACIYNLYSIFMSAKMRFSKLDVKEVMKKKMLLGGLIGFTLVTWFGSIMIWATSDVNLDAEFRQLNYKAGIAALITVLEILAAIFSLDIFSLVNMIFASRILSHNYNILFGGSTGNFRAGALAIVVGVIGVTTWPLICKMLANRGKELDADGEGKDHKENVAGVALPSFMSAEMRPMFLVGVIWIVAAWFGLAETDSNAAAKKTLLELSIVVGYLGAILLMGQFAKAADHLKLVFYVTVLTHFDFWPFALGKFSIMGTFGITTYFCQLGYMIMYARNFGGTPLVALTPKENAALTEKLVNDSKEPA